MQSKDVGRLMYVTHRSGAMTFMEEAHTGDGVIRGESLHRLEPLFIIDVRKFLTKVLTRHGVRYLRHSLIEGCEDTR